MSSSRTTLNQKFFATVPEPKADAESLRQTVLAIKQTLEVMTNQRKPFNAAAVTFQDMIDLGFLDSDGKTLQDNGGLLKQLNDTLAAGTISGALQAANNLSDVANAGTSRTNLGLAIGTDVLAYDAQLTSNIRQNQQDAAYTLVLGDGEKHIYHTSASAHTWTIPANSSVAFPVGTCVTFINDGSGAVTIAITTDTLVWSPSGSTGSRTLAQYGMATAIKVTSTRWLISGSGLT